MVLDGIVKEGQNGCFHIIMFQSNCLNFHHLVSQNISELFPLVTWHRIGDIASKLLRFVFTKLFCFYFEKQLCLAFE